MPDGVLLDTLSKPFDRAEFADQSSFVDANSIVVRRHAGIIFSRLPRVKATLPKEDREFIYRLSKTHRIEHIAVPTVVVSSTPTATTPSGSPNLGQLAHAARCGAWLP